MPSVKLDFPTLNATLPRFPLLEAILELRWELQKDPKTERLRDPSYPVLYGRLYDRLKKDFPILEDLPASQAHPESAPYALRHRMRREKNGYPLVQIGPGIVTVNAAKEYSWENFSKLGLEIASSIAELFPLDLFPLHWIKAELRYVNAVSFEPAKEKPLSFLEDKLHVRLGVDGPFFSQGTVHPDPIGVNFHLIYPLLEPKGHLILAGALGEIEGKSAFLLQTVIDSLGKEAPPDRNAIAEWLEEAHKAGKESFETLCRGSLMERFLGR